MSVVQKEEILMIRFNLKIIRVFELKHTLFHFLSILKLLLPKFLEILVIFTLWLGDIRFLRCFLLAIYEANQTEDS